MPIVRLWHKKSWTIRCQGLFD